MVLERFARIIAGKGKYERGKAELDRRNAELRNHIELVLSRSDRSIDRLHQYDDLSIEELVDHAHGEVFYSSLEVGRILSDLEWQEALVVSRLLSPQVIVGIWNSKDAISQAHRDAMRGDGPTPSDTKQIDS